MSLYHVLIITDRLNENRYRLDRLKRNTGLTLTFRCSHIIVYNKNLCNACGIFRKVLIGTAFECLNVSFPLQTYDMPINSVKRTYNRRTGSE